MLGARKKARAKAGFNRAAQGRITCLARAVVSQIFAKLDQPQAGRPLRIGATTHA
jgi:hypothetical protein